MHTVQAKRRWYGAIVTVFKSAACASYTSKSNYVTYITATIVSLVARRSRS